MAKAETKIDQDPTENYISIGLGLLVVVVIGVLLYNYFTNKNAQKTTETNPSETTEEATTSAKPGGVYTVAEGDTLWSISEKSYGTGFNWTEIARANNISESAQLEPGQKITIPEIAGVTSEASPSTIAQVVASPEVASPKVAAASPSPAVLASQLPQTGIDNTNKDAAQITISGNSYTVVSGDTLWDISCKAYGDCYKWTEIAQTNKMENPGLIFPGDVVALPR